MRQAVHFLRRNEGDGELIAPTLFPRKKRRTGKAKGTQSKGKRKEPKDTGGAGSGDALN